MADAYIFDAVRSPRGKEVKRAGAYMRLQLCRCSLNSLRLLKIVMN